MLILGRIHWFWQRGQGIPQIAVQPKAPEHVQLIYAPEDDPRFIRIDDEWYELYSDSFWQEQLTKVIDSGWNFHLRTGWQAVPPIPGFGLDSVLFIIMARSVRWPGSFHTIGRPMTAAEYEARIAELAALARLHRALGHPWPARECLTCSWVDRRRQELARQFSP